MPGSGAEKRRRRARLIEICSSLPEVAISGDEHLAFKVRKKIFAYYLDDHRGDRRVALCCKTPLGEQGRLVEEEPERFYVPPYIGPRGWVGLRLDSRRVNWSEVAYLVRTAYRLIAPRALAVRVE
jgi:hypothetical protein